MGSFFVHAGLGGEPPDTGRANRSLAALGVAGAPPGSLSLLPFAALGQRADTSDGGESPLVAGGDVHVLFAGRLDNREELASALGLSADPVPGDSALALAAYLRWREDCLPRLQGPFVLVAVEAGGRRLLAARDVLGDRRLVYAVDGPALLVASGEHQLLADRRLDRRLDETSIARYFAYQGPTVGRTYFETIHELPPGFVLNADDSGLQLTRFDGVRIVRSSAATDGERQEELRETLGRAVSCRLRPRGRRCGVLMSGGLDSTSLAALAVDRAGGGQGVPAVSWGFDRLPAADERALSEKVGRQLGIDLITVPGDGLRPEVAAGLSHPADFPGADPYRPLLVAALRAAREHGIDRLLTGHHANQLWAGGDYWLRDLVTEGRIRAAAVGLGHLLVRGAGARPRGRTLRSAAARLAGWRGGAAAVAPWLTPRARELSRSEHSDGPRTGRGEIDRWGALAGYWSYEAHRLRLLALGEDVEVCFPYRDRRVVELFLGLPAHLLYRPGESKRLQRRAMTGLLPEAVREQHRPANLFAWIAAGLRSSVLTELLKRLEETVELWGRWVRRDWLRERLQAAEPEPRASGIAWRCLAYADWVKTHVAC